MILPNRTGEQQHGALLKAHCRLRYRGASASAYFDQRGKEWIVAIKGVGKLAGPAASERQRRSDSKPRVGATRLPWVKRPELSQPQRGCDLMTSPGRNPVGVEIHAPCNPRVACGNPGLEDGTPLAFPENP